MTGKLRFYGFVTVLASMVIFLLGLAGYHYSVKTTGRVVRLATEPVDPRSLFRGDYVQLRYDINTIQAREHEVSDGDRVYVTLQRSDTVWEAQYIQRQYPDSVRRNEAVIRGRYRETDNSGLRVRYPSIESYFVPEGKGRRIERFQGKGLRVEVALGSSGYPVIRRLIMPE